LTGLARADTACLAASCSLCLEDRVMGRTMIIVAVLGGLYATADTRAADPAGAGRAGRRVPIIYSSDLFHPHEDPDDHFDLATLFAIGEFDIRAILLDQGDKQAERPGEIPLRQMMRLTGRVVPSAIGLNSKLRSPRGQGPRSAGGFSGGRAAAAANASGIEAAGDCAADREPARHRRRVHREPALLREKVGRLYLNTGHAGGDKEWNVGLDPHAYVRVMRSGLPVYWVPCFGPEGYGSLWKFRHDRVLEGVSPRLQNFFIYALAKVPPDKLDPVAALSQGLETLRQDRDVDVGAEHVVHGVAASRGRTRGHSRCRWDMAIGARSPPPRRCRGRPAAGPRDDGAVLADRVVRAAAGAARRGRQDAVRRWGGRCGGRRVSGGATRPPTTRP